jgi:predicted GIY-YIG superfamily endonuclease
VITVYILECEDGWYYVGLAYKPLKARLDKHFTRTGPMFTRYHRARELLHSFEVEDEIARAMEDEVTLEMMLAYGPNNVRGGKYVQRRDFSRSKTLRRELMKRSSEAIA